MEEGGPSGCRFVVEEGKLEDRAVLAQLGSVGRIMAQARAAFASMQGLISTPPCAGRGILTAGVQGMLRFEAQAKARTG